MNHILKKGAGVKSLSLKSAMIVLISTLVWLGYYLIFPDYPLHTKETVVVVFLCTLLVLGVQALWKYFSQRGKKA